jgi:hypothetical protein
MPSMHANQCPEYGKVYDERLAGRKKDLDKVVDWSAIV